MPLNELAAGARLSASAAHRYLVSFSRTGLVQQDPITRLYDLGPGATTIGIAAIGRSKLLSRAEETQLILRAELDETVVLAVWGTYGPVILSVAESSKAVVLTMRVGVTMPLLRTATGWVFTAFMPPSVVNPIIDAEVAAGRGDATMTSPELFEAKLTAIRADHLAFHTGDLLRGVPAAASPLLGPRGELVAVISVFGHSESFDPAPGGKIAARLKDVALRFADSRGD
jgi:DNA-binding IclR family transcriptional regulator